jgi:hypothetical protein
MNRAREWIIANALIIALVFAGLMMAAAAVQTVRLDGLQLRLPLIGSIGPKGWIARAEAAEARNAHLALMRELATKAAIEARRSEEQALVLLAKETDNAINMERASEAGRTERFIAAGGLRDNARCAGGSAAASALHRAGDSPPLHPAPQLDEPERLPAPEIVGVLAGDVRTCTENTLLAEGWRSLLLGLESRGQD